MQQFFYNIFLFVFELGIRIFAQWNLKARQWVVGRKHVFEELEARLKSDRHPSIIWIHSASLGEFEQGRPILESLRETYPSHKILVTFFSASGYETRKNYPLAHYIYYLPHDSPINAPRFIELVKPKIVIWIKYDYWYYYLTTLKQKNIPVLLVAAIFRKEMAFFKWYGKLYRSMLYCFHQIFIQNPESAAMLQTIGINDRVTVAGDTRFDRVVAVAESFTPIPAIADFCGNHPVVVAGSTWPADEEALDHFATNHPLVRFVVAPHDVTPERLQEVEVLFPKIIRFSVWEKLSAEEKAAVTANTLLIDNVGMLSRLYHYASIAYVGGGFENEGIHNILEAAVYGIPVVFGPEYDWFLEAQDLIDRNAAFSIESSIELEEQLKYLLDNQEACKESGRSALEYVIEKRGATKLIVDYIQENRLLIN